MTGNHFLLDQMGIYQPVVTQSLINPQWKYLVASTEGTGTDPKNLAEHNYSLLLEQVLKEIQDHQSQQEEFVAHEKVLAQVIARICQSLDLKTIFETAMAELRQILYVDRVAIFQFNLDSSSSKGSFVAEDVAPEFRAPLTAQIHDFCLGEYSRVEYEKGQILAISDTTLEGLSDDHLQTLSQFKIRANLVVPLLHQQKLWGLLCLHQCCGPRLWQNAEVDFVSRIALQLGLALQQAELFEKARLDASKIEAQKQQLERVAKQERTLMQVIECIRKTLDMKQIFATATRVVRQLLQADRVAIFRFENMGLQPTKGEFVAEDLRPSCPSVVGANLRDQRFGESYAIMHRGGEILAIADTYDDYLSDEQFQILSKLQIRADLVIPLLQGQVLWGLLCLHQCDGPRSWKESEIEFTVRIGTQLSVALQQAELFEQTQSHSLELQRALAEVNLQKEQLTQIAAQEKASAYVMRRIRQSLDVNHIFRVTTQEAQQILNCDRVLVYQFRPDWGGEVIFESVSSQWQPLLDETNAPLHWDDTYLQDLQGGFYRNLAPTITPDIYQANYSLCHIQHLETFQIRASIIVPIFIGETLWGLLGAYQNTNPRDWQTWEVRLLEKVGDQLGIALQQAELLQQLQTAKEEADTASQSKSQFLASMSHELRTPLNAILGFSQLMRRDPNITPAQQETLDIINQSGAHLLNLINDVLEMSKIEAGKATLSPSDFNLRSLLASIHAMLNLKADTKGLELNFICLPEVPHIIQADENKLRQILINLVGNALKFTQHGKVMLQVSAKGQTLQPSEHSHQRCTLYFTVEDTGPGISTTDLETLFDAFTQTEVGRKSVDGTGLGLPISRHFARLMGGDITITSQWGHGTTVQFYVQAQVASMAELPGSPQQRVLGLAPDQPCYRILVAEDRLENRQLMVQLLKSVGFEVQAVANGEEAINQWQFWRPHLIWMDWAMPKLNGSEATQRIRKVEQLRARVELGEKAEAPSPTSLVVPPSAAFAPLSQTIILALTASVFENTRQQILAAGCDDIVYKPFQEAEIFEKMALYLGVQYVYETLIEPPAQQMLNADDLQQCLAEQSSEWLSAIQEAAIKLDEDEVCLLIGTLESCNTVVANELMNLVKTVEFDRLVDLAQQALSLQSSLILH